MSQLHNRVDQLLKGHSKGDLQTAQRIREFHPRWNRENDAAIFSAKFTLSDAELTIARESGFETWKRMERWIEQPSPEEDLNLPFHQRIPDPIFRRAVDLLDAGDAEGLNAHLHLHQNLVHQRVKFEGGNYFQNPSLLEFVAENPIRHGRLPANILEVARLILDAGAKQDQQSLDETLGLVCSGRIVQECGAQRPLIHLLCDYGAKPDSALPHAFGNREAVSALLQRGARLDLAAAAALGQLEELLRLMPHSTSEDRHRALALSAQFGHTQIARLLLDTGEDPDRYNPPACHGHSTPLHQAAFAGHEAMVHLLVERGARLDLKDIIWQGTPEGWALHSGHTHIAEYLRAKSAPSLN